MSSAHIDEFRKFYIGQSENQVDSPMWAKENTDHLNVTDKFDAFFLVQRWG
jgi:hypothetical protein